MQGKGKRRGDYKEWKARNGQAQVLRQYGEKYDGVTVLVKDMNHRNACIAPLIQMAGVDNFLSRSFQPGEQRSGKGNTPISHSTEEIALAPSQ
jgi:hypothetical protein